MIIDILEAEIIILKARQAAVREWIYNKNFQLESRVIDKNIIYLEAEIKKIKSE